MQNVCDDLLSLFLEEFDERVTKIEDLLLSDDCASEVSIRAVKRELHTLKGNSGAVGFPSCSSLCHELENCLESGANTTTVIDHLLDGIQVLRGAVCSMAEGRDIDDEVRASLPMFDEARSELLGSLARQDENDPSAQDDVRQFAALKAQYVICVATADGQFNAASEGVAPYGTRYFPVASLLQDDAQAFRALVSGANLAILQVDSDPHHIVGLIRAIETFRITETMARQFGEQRLNIIAIVEGGSTNDCRELRTAGAQYAFPSSCDGRIPQLVDRLFREKMHDGKARKNLRFREFETTIAIFGDGTRLKASVCDESFTGIALRVLDPSPCDFMAPVAVEVLGVAMPAYIVRQSGRDERGYVKVGLRWGRADAPSQGAMTVNERWK